MSAVRSWISNVRPRFVLGIAAVALIAGGGSTLGVAVASQDHAPQPGPAVAGSTGPLGLHHGVSATPGSSTPQSTSPESSSSIPTVTPNPPVSTLQGPVVATSVPVAISIPTIGVQSSVESLGLNLDGTLAVPQPGPLYNDAAWYNGSPTPGQLGPSIIEGHIDSASDGPSVFFRLGALQPGNEIDVTLTNGMVAVFSVTGVRQYPKDGFPTATVYGNTNFAALRLITCGGDFDPTTGHYLANTVVYAALTSSHPA